MRYILVIFGILGLDLSTKKLISEQMEIGEEKEIIKNTFYFRHIKNTGFAYHKFAGQRKLILSLTSAIIGIQTFLLHKKIQEKNKGLSMAHAVIMGGALGNFLERWKKNHVTDFLFIKKGSNAPIFNIADLALFFGFLLYFFHMNKED
ncbi:MAG: signal peptidase II [Bacillota bacterium]